MFTDVGTLRSNVSFLSVFIRVNPWLKEIMRIEPTNIQQIGDELAIQWNDQTESYLNIEMLRRVCPCAACGGEPDVLGNIERPQVNYTDKSFQLVGFELVGGY